MAFFPFLHVLRPSLSPEGEIRLNYFRPNQARITVWNRAAVLNVLKRGMIWGKKIFFVFFLRRRKEPVCVLRPPCDSGSCLLAGASIPAQLDSGATLLSAGKTSEYRGGPQAATQPAARGHHYPAVAPRRRSQPRHELVPVEPRCGPLRGPVPVLLQLIDRMSRMLKPVDLMSCLSQDC